MKVSFTPPATSASASFWSSLGSQVLDKFKGIDTSFSLNESTDNSVSIDKKSNNKDFNPQLTQQRAFRDASTSVSAEKGEHQWEWPGQGMPQQPEDSKMRAVQGRLHLANLFDVPTATATIMDTNTAPTITTNTNDDNCPTGTLHLFSKLSLLKQADKQLILVNTLAPVIHTIEHRLQPTLANMFPFSLLVHPDLKAHVYTHWFCVPAIVARDDSLWSYHHDQPEWRVESRQNNLVARIETAAANYRSQNTENTVTKDISLCFIFHDSKSSAVSLPDCDFSSKDITLVVRDSGVDKCPSWPLRNILAWLGVHAPQLVADGIPVILLRPDPFECLSACLTNSAMGDTEKLGLVGKAIGSGWQKNANGKMAPNRADLGSMMDPVRLADQAVNLNLKLMRWRILPELDLERIASTKCLLLGAGTLGCHVARTLLAWGVTDITLLDSGNVSYSNPVRQPLFNFEDCMEGGKPKAECAAEALKKIYPGVNSKGIKMSIPMPGHPLSESEISSTAQDVSTLSSLIENSDAVFLLMDSRESRWLPTLIGTQKNKIVINAALGFDSYMVMRHGHFSSESKTPRLSCYFCQDITAPADSLSDRTMDQMCTVTRPGLAAIAGATAVELLVTLRTNSFGNQAPAATSSTERMSKATGLSPLGIVPHQIRGFLGAFSTTLMHGEAYTKCSACSEKVLDAYANEGFSFLEKVFASPTYLEQISGLEELQLESEAVEGWDDVTDDENENI